MALDLEAFQINDSKWLKHILIIVGSQLTCTDLLEGCTPHCERMDMACAMHDSIELEIRIPTPQSPAAHPTWVGFQSWHQQHRHSMAQCGTVWHCTFSDHINSTTIVQPCHSFNVEVVKWCVTSCRTRDYWQFSWETYLAICIRFWFAWLAEGSYQRASFFPWYF